MRYIYLRSWSRLQMNFNLTFAALILASCYCCCHGLADVRPSNILVFLPTETRSHFNGFKPLLEALVVRGHNLTLVSPYPLGTTAEDGSPLLYTHVSVETTIKGVSGVNHLDKKSLFNTLPHYLYVLWLGPAMTRMALNKPAVREFVARDDGTRFDLVVFENFFHECFVALGHKYAAPVVQLLPFSENSRVSQWHGNPYNPSYVVDHVRSFAGPMTFAQRVHNTVCAVFHTWVNRLVYMPQQRAIAYEHFAYGGHERRPDLETMLRNVSLTLINGHPLLGSVAPLVPGYVHVAGMHVKPAKTLPPDLKTVLDDSGDRGVVFFSLGSVIQSSKMPRETVSLLLSELAKIEQTVLWKWEDDRLPNLPKNVIVRKWFPQNDVLGHPNCRLFITHGGIHSLIESIYHGIPILSISVFGDQTHNSVEAELRGFALHVPYFELTAETFGTRLRRLLSDTKFSEAAKRASSILRDNPTSIMDKAVFWIEHVIRHNGAPHLRTAANDLYWFQLHLLDVIAVIFLATVLVLYLNYKCFAYLLKKTCGTKSKVAKGSSSTKKTQ